ncbi:primosome assembly protein PriA [Gottschalkia acidurici 9a]|uniref:Replication restart protein PriA n=1 Tax=Gottschalkia acidurici (strain ATCC 7906 / DSM 604 / BCRC 14475 / CIP 104303 / KCTC 5404 / NCIMB 10678 / 9a) TaxID=1128398 RepID=K0AY22_GOTA9|nr:primosomal protein N' [Gottschalkia acidurici]AFS78693.1 primosome assembly protein PriA [Gottschalkia acidurici 9a]
MEKFLYAEIIVDNTSLNTDRLYTYKVPEKYIEKIKIGMRCLVPFGKGNKLLEGIIISLKDNIDFNPNRVKEIKRLVEDTPIISENMIKLSSWMKDEYLCTHLEVLKTIIPTGITNKSIKCVTIGKNINKLDYFSFLNDNQKKIIDYLNKNKEVELQELKKQSDIKNIDKNLNDLINKNIVEIVEKISQEINKKYEKYIFKNFSEQETDKVIETLSKSAHKQIEVLKYISNRESISLKEVMEKNNIPLSSIKSLEEKGYLRVEEREVSREAINKEIKVYEKAKLTYEQQICVDTIYNNYINSKNNKHLLHGVTGSGKTEVYLQMIEKILKLEKQAIVLVPEISLTPQTVERFAGRFEGNVAVLHSGLSLGERYDEWRKIKEGRVQIVVGARSAIFAPFDNLGIIIIDEEHETSYKSSTNPKYNTIEVAEKRCDIEDAILILGSATPSIETYYNAKLGKLNLLTLPSRINNRELPPMEVINMKEELENGNKTIFSKRLYEEIIFNLENRKQTILFLNRRGFSTFISCRKCGYVLKCESCDISLTYHTSSNNLRCHYCGLSRKLPETCPECGSSYIKHFGIGTQRVEELVKKSFPSAKVARMDVDTTTRKGSHERILNKFKNGQIDILIGTQMISKGLDFPNVTLVGIIAADTSLNLPDFKASERTFQLLTQVGGRAGRGELEGKVILQTYEPDHYSIKAAQKHNYIEFFNEEIGIRKAFEYPPFISLINIIISSKNENEVFKASNKVFHEIRDEIHKRLSTFSHKNILGPNQSLIYKIRDRYRWQILIKCSQEELKKIKKIIEKVCIIDKESNIKDIRINIDINPVSIL